MLIRRLAPPPPPIYSLLIELGAFYLRPSSARSLFALFLPPLPLVASFYAHFVGQVHWQEVAFMKLFARARHFRIHFEMIFRALASTLQSSSLNFASISFTIFDFE
jgi:hypothetical protein